MKKVLFLSAPSSSDILAEMGRSYAPVFAEMGLELVPLAMERRDEFGKKLAEVLQTDVEFAFGFGGSGHALTFDAPGQTALSVWQTLRIPYIGLYGDSPAYYFDVHRQMSPYSIGLYSFDEHLLLRRQLPFQPGVLGTWKAAPIHELQQSEIDFERKKRGKIIFLKNGNSPQVLMRFWQQSFDASTRDHLLAIKDIAEAELATVAPPSIQAIVEGYLTQLGVDPTSLLRLRLLLITQIDDYMRRIKSELVADVMLDFPTEVRGLRWNHLNRSNRVGTLIEKANFVESNGLIKDALAIVDMSPNTITGFHDRQCRSAGAYTLCVSNEQPIITATFADCAHATYRFTRDSIANRIESVLADPGAAVALGLAMSEQFRTLYPLKKELERWRSLAALVRTDQMTERPAGAPDFLGWPPTAF